MSNKLYNLVVFVFAFAAFAFVNAHVLAMMLSYVHELDIIAITLGIGSIQDVAVMGIISMITTTLWILSMEGIRRITMK